MRVPRRHFAALGSAVLCALALDASAAAEIFVGSDTEILVFADDASGDVVPLRKMAGRGTGMTAVIPVAADRVSRGLWVRGCPWRHRPLGRS